MRTRLFSRLAAGLCAAGVLLSEPSPSHASRMFQNTSVGRTSTGSRVPCSDAGGFAHWNVGPLNWRHNTSGQGAGKAAALQSALFTWNSAPHTMIYAGTTSAGFVTDNINTFVFAVGNGCNNNCLALTALVLQQGQVIVESDVTFNANYTWRTNGSDIDTWAVATHELGHTLGIHHTEDGSDPRPTMDTPYFGTAMRSLESDDIVALYCSDTRYGPRASGSPSPPSSLQATSERCRGLNTLSWPAVSGATRYELYRSNRALFAPETLEFSGSSTSKLVNVTGTTHFRVRACNAAGCGRFRYNRAPAERFPGCQ